MANRESDSEGLFIVERSSQLFNCLQLSIPLEVLSILLSALRAALLYPTRRSWDGILLPSFGYSRRIYPCGKSNVTRRAVEKCVLMNLALALLLLLLSSGGVEAARYLSYYGAWRVYGIIVTLINMVLFDKYRGDTARKEAANKRESGPPASPPDVRRLMTLVLLNYLEVILWFALFYQFSGCAFNVDLGGLPFSSSCLQSLNLSFDSMTLIDSSAIEPDKPIGRLLSAIQSAIGWGMLVLVIGGVAGVVWSELQGKDEAEGEDGSKSAGDPKE